MTPQELFAESRLSEAIAALECSSTAGPSDRLLLVQLLLFAGRLADARRELALIDSEDAGWPALARSLLHLIRAEHRRIRGRIPQVRPGPPPRHVVRRWRALRALRQGNPELATQLIDRADAATPDLRGFLDGQEFELLRDADEGFASVLEALISGEYTWLPWEELRSVRLDPPQFARDHLFRPAVVRLVNGRQFPAHLPLVYPRSFAAGDEFATGLATDFTSEASGPTRCIGAKLLLIGDEAEIRLADVTMIEIRQL